jgi:hypothetical protein
LRTVAFISLLFEDGLRVPGAMKNSCDGHGAPLQ